MKFNIPGLFYSKRHFIGYICMIIFFVAVIIFEIIFANLASWTSGYAILFVISLLLIIILSYYAIPFPLLFIEFKTNKKKDYSIIKNYTTKSLEQNISVNMKNHLRIALLRYAIVFNINDAKALVKDIFAPKKNIESIQLLYFKAMTEYYVVIGADRKFKETIDSMSFYKVPKNMYNKYQLLYLLLIGDKLNDKDMETFDFASINLVDTCLSLFARGLYYSYTGNDEYLTKSIDALTSIDSNNTYGMILKHTGNMST